MQYRYRDVFGNMAVSALLTPIVFLIFSFVFMYAREEYSSWSANQSLNEFSHLTDRVERETQFVIKLGNEISEIRSWTVRKGENSRETGIVTVTLRDACLDLQRAVGDYNKAVQPAYSITMSDPISMQIHQEVNPVAKSYCIQYGNWR
jgi:hypothetical protein